MLKVSFVKAKNKKQKCGVGGWGGGNPNRTDCGRCCSVALET